MPTLPASGLTYLSSVETSFSAAHQLCDTAHKTTGRLHGHNFVVTASVASQTLDACNLAVDFRVLKEALDALVQPWDHRFLNELPPFEGQSPSLEYLAQWIFNALSAEFPSVVQVCVSDQPDQRVCFGQSPYRG